MWESLKNTFLTVIIFSILGGLAYFAYRNLDSGSNYVIRQKVRDLEGENEKLKEELKKLEEKLAVYEPVVKPENTPVSTTEIEPVPKSNEAVSIYKYASLIKELEDLIQDDVHMKLKSRGTRVGTAQNFLNLYNKTENKIDNDYGESTKRAVSAFQKASGLTQSGEADKATFQKMIDWLKKQG